MVPNMCKWPTNAGVNVRVGMGCDYLKDIESTYVNKPAQTIRMRVTMKQSLTKPVKDDTSMVT